MSGRAPRSRSDTLLAFQKAREQARRNRSGTQTAREQARRKRAAEFKRSAAYVKTQGRHAAAKRRHAAASSAKLKKYSKGTGLSATACHKELAKAKATIQRLRPRSTFTGEYRVTKKGGKRRRIYKGKRLDGKGNYFVAAEKGGLKRQTFSTITAARGRAGNQAIGGNRAATAIQKIARGKAGRRPRKRLVGKSKQTTKRPQLAAAA